jgi:hypothetical protein
MRKANVISWLLLGGCHLQFQTEDYYAGGGQPPQVQGISQVKENGNVGGDTVTIYGKGFGADTEAVTVIFGSQNAPVLSADGQSMTVRVPQGPVQGGTVDVVVGTTGGQAKVPGGYNYDTGALVQNQAGYVLVKNGWQSCRLGLGFQSELISPDDCSGWASQGHVGLEGRATFLEVPFPNMHTMYLGWGGASDQSGKWKIQSPGQSVNSYDMESAYEDLLRDDVDGLQLINLAYESEDPPEDRYWCADLHNLASYRFQGGRDGDETYGSSSILPGDSQGGWLSLVDEASVEQCLESEGNRLIDRATMNFCETYEADTPHTRVFEADWLAGASFFPGGEFGCNDGIDNNNDGDVDGADRNCTYDLDTESGPFLLNIPDLRVSEELTLPPPVHFEAVQGWDVGDQDVADLFASHLANTTCQDDNGDGAFTLDEAAMRFEWEPYDGELTPREAGRLIKESRVQVRFTITIFDVGWLGAAAIPIRATVTVPDFNDYDEDRDRSSLEVPGWLLYQFPTVNLSWGQSSTIGGTSTYIWGDPEATDSAYFIITIDRITEYSIHSDDLVGDLVFAYVTSDESIFQWENPLDNPTGCGDCVDNDGDGWTDSLDPDCLRGTIEDNTKFGESTCNDGVDNDNDGRVDADDPDCTAGRDTESPDCGDFQDNDEDGWVDGDDPDCMDGSLEDNHGYGRFGCNDGLDNDGDGWTDRDDPGCTDALQDEQDGFSSYACNDGIDNDGHGDIDGEDLMCINEGAKHSVEQADPLDAECANGEDDDLDGYVDGNDPDCDYSPWGFERAKWRDPEDYPGIRQCYNGIDDDGDGCIDAEDPGCLNAEGEPDGFLNDESAADPTDGPCESEDTGVGFDSGR